MSNLTPTIEQLQLSAFAAALLNSSRYAAYSRPQPSAAACTLNALQQQSIPSNNRQDFGEILRNNLQVIQQKTLQNFAFGGADTFHPGIAPNQALAKLWTPQLEPPKSTHPQTASLKIVQSKKSKIAAALGAKRLSSDESLESDLPLKKEKTSDTMYQRRMKRPSDFSYDYPYKRPRPYDVPQSGRPIRAGPPRPMGSPKQGTLRPYEYEQISDAILTFHSDKQQLQSLYEKKMKLRDALYAIFKNVFPYCGLYIVGSSMSGFGAQSSDMDMCLMISQVDIDQKREATEILRILNRALKNCTFLRELQLIRAKVPILKFKDKYSGVECDLNINNAVGIRNTHLLNCYCKLDSRLGPLVIFVKHWAKTQNINDASQGTISSYSLVLMVIHFLQYGCTPPVLPSLQQMYPHKFNTSIDVRLLTLNENLPQYISQNTLSLGELLVGFLLYYAHQFDFHNDAISIRLGQTMSKDVAMMQNPRRNPPTQWKWLCIEEPFDLSNTARSVYDEFTFQKIWSVIRKSFSAIRASGNVSSILDNPL